MTDSDQEHEAGASPKKSLAESEQSAGASLSPKARAKKLSLEAEAGAVNELGNDDLLPVKKNTCILKTNSKCQNQFQFLIDPNSHGKSLRAHITISFYFVFVLTELTTIFDQRRYKKNNLGESDDVQIEFPSPKSSLHDSGGASPIGSQVVAVDPNESAPRPESVVSSAVSSPTAVKERIGRMGSPKEFDLAKTTSEKLDEYIEQARLSSREAGFATVEPSSFSPPGSKSVSPASVAGRLSPPGHGLKKLSFKIAPKYMCFT